MCHLNFIKSVLTLCRVEGLAKKCRGKGQKCCSASDNEDMSGRIFKKQKVRYPHYDHLQPHKQATERKFNLLIPVLGLKKFLYKSATDRKRWSLRHHIRLWWWLKRRKYNFTDWKYQLLTEDDPESGTNVPDFLFSYASGPDVPGKGICYRNQNTAASTWVTELISSQPSHISVSPAPPGGSSNLPPTLDVLL